MNYTVIKNGIKIKKLIIEVIQIACGTALMAMATSFFLLPNQLSSGGFSGISTILYYLFQFPMGTSILLLNIPLFILSIFKNGKKFFIKALIGTALLSIFIDVFDKYSPLTSDRLLACIYGGILIGIGTAIILRSNASTGGSDLLAQIVRKYKTHFRTGSLITGLDIFIVALNVIFFKEIEIGLYSAITIYIMGKVIDIFFEGIYFTKLMYIISEKHEEISKKIQEEAGRGATGLYAKGLYKNEEKMVLLCAVSRNEVSQIKRIAKQIDDKAFIMITNAREVVGKGFKKE